MEKPQKFAQEILRKYKLSKPTLDDALFILQEQGYEIIDFDPGGNNELFNELSLDKGVTKQGAFLYTNNRVKLFFIRETLDEDEKLYATAHELGHILCKHDQAEPSVREEYEANEFAHYFLHPSKNQRAITAVSRRKWISIGIILSVILLSLAGLWGWNNYIDGKYSNYYVTSTGTKYHRKNCSLIKDKGNLRRLTKEDVQSGAYEACGVCLGGELLP